MVGCLSVPVSADTPLLPGDTVAGFVVLDIGDAFSTVYEDTMGNARQAGAWLRWLWDHDNCPSLDSPNGKHSFNSIHTTHNGVLGHYWMCEYCGKFGGEAAQDGNNAMVETLPASGVTSGGSMVIVADGPHKYITIGANGGTFYCPDSGKTSSSLSYPPSFSWSESNNSFVVVPNVDRQYFQFNYANAFFEFSAPVSGYYNRLENVSFEGSYILSSTSELVSVVSYNKLDTSSTYINVGEGYIYQCPSGIPGNTNVKNVQGRFYPPEFEVIPDSGAVDITSSGDTYNIDSRPTSIQGDLAYYNNSGELTLSTGDSIVNETNSTVYNPVTDTTYNMTDWAYDYGDRTYTITTDAGDTVTVKYGDENITIHEGDSNYTVYYVTEYEAPAHTHSYTGSVTTQPTCTASGVKTYVCSECNDTYTEAVPALGHDWQIKTQVQTSYDEQGQLETQGYTIYRCSRCGEEYRTDDSVNPSPPVTTETPQGDLVEVYIPSGLERLRDKILSFFNTLPEMFRAVTDFLKDAFAYIPEEILYLIEFGVAMAVLVALLKMLWR